MDQSPFTSTLHEAGISKNGQVLGHGGLRDVEASGEVSDDRLSVGKALEDRTSAGVSQCAKHDVFPLHARTISGHLVVVKAACFFRAAVTGAALHARESRVRPLVVR